MKREIKFNAWIPALEIMLYDVDVYSNGMIGIVADEFEKIIREKNDNWHIYDDGVFLSDDEHFDRLISLNCGDEYYWIEDADCIKLQFTGLKDKNGKPIYEGDLVRCDDIIIDVIWKDAAFHIITNKFQGSGVFVQERAKRFEKIGNIYENPELL